MASCTTGGADGQLCCTDDEGETGLRCCLQAALTGDDKLERDGVRGVHGSGNPLDSEADPLLDPLPTVGLMTHSDDFYPKVAINALLKQLRDVKMAPQHSEVVTALMYIFKDLRLGAVAYLPSALPVLFSVVRHSEEGLQQYILKQLIDLVRIVQGHMRRWLPDFLELVKEFWDLRRPLLLKLQLHLLAWLAKMLQARSGPAARVCTMFWCWHGAAC